MKQLDQGGSGYQAIIERELSARLAQRGSTSPPASGSEKVHAATAIARACACGTTNDADAVFCKRCGTKL
jgi:hypothetical protein